MNLTKSTTIGVLLMLSLTITILADKDDKVIKVADMEKKTIFSFTPKDRAKASFSEKTSSQGRRSLRFEFNGKDKDRAGVGFPFTGDMSEHSIFAFDFYCENNNGATMTPHIYQKVKNQKKETADSYCNINLMDGRDGWTSVRLKKRDFEFREKGGYKQDWSKVNGVSIGFGRGMKGKLVVYFDNIRFEKPTDEDNQNANLILNGSFETTTSPGTPDGWHRDLNIPPFGKKIWGIDNQNTFHGKNSLRIGLKGKYAATGGYKTTRLVKGKDYTFSIYMKSNQDDTQAEIRLSGIKAKTKRTIAKVGKEWQRYVVTGKAKSIGAACSIKLLSANAVLWLDGAQLVEGDKPLPLEEIKQDDRNNLAEETPKRLNSKPVETHITETNKAPVIDGNGDDPCWENAQPITNFVNLKENTPAKDKTIAKVTFDDKALYIFVQAFENDMERVKKALEASENGPWGTDLAEIFIDFNGDLKSYHQLAANSKGEKYLSLRSDKKTSRPCEWKVAGKTLNDSWTVEIEIPYTSFDLAFPPKADEIGLNICRTSLGKEKRYSTWSFPFGSFRNPKAFGIAKGFNPKKLKGFLYDVLSIDWKNGKATATIVNKTGKEEELDIAFDLKTPDGNIKTSEKLKTKLPVNTAIDMAIPFPIAKDGLYKLSVSGKDRNGLKRFIADYTPLRVKGASLFELSGTEFDFYTSDKEAKVRCFVGVAPAKCKEFSIKFDLIKNEKSVNHGTIKAESGFNEFKLPLTKLENGTYKLVVELVEKDNSVAKKICEFRKLPPAKQEVRINHWGRYFVHNGKSILIYGFYDNNVGKGDLKAWDDACADMSKAHCNSHLAYMGNNPNVHAEIGKYLDAALKHKQMVWVHLSGMFAWHIKKYARSKRRYTNDKDAMEGLRKVVSKYKDHPALMGWATLDEPGNRPHIFTKSIVTKYYDAVKALDPHHPCILSHVTHLGESKVYGDATDCAQIPYIARGGRYDHLFEEFWNIGKPIIINCPCYGGIGNVKYEPTPGLQRTRMYKGIILGARGVCTYTYRPAGPALWNEFILVGEELETLAPSLLTPDEKLRLDITPKGQDVFAVLKRKGKKYFLIAVNTAPKPLAVSFRTPDIDFTEVKPMFKTKQAEINKKLKQIKLKMDRESTAIFEITM